MIPARVIGKKRDGASLEVGELESFLHGYLGGDVEEHQMAAFLMAVCFQGLSPLELDVLVRVMVESGEVLDLDPLRGPAVDKHSTGGVGDKVSLALAPLAAELGLQVPMMAGRGLGHTGGTLDKLEAIPGFRTALTIAEFLRVLEDVGCAMIGQTAEIAPLDRRLYALRDVTGTVSSIPLIAASIMSKKLAEDIEGLVLDVKVGEGAFIPEEARALELARTMVEIGERNGVHTRALLTAMDRPLGRAVGNALETAEAVQCLRGEGPPDLAELVLELAAEMALAGGVEADRSRARARAEAALSGGGALERFRRLVAAQGGNPAVTEGEGVLPRAPETAIFQAERGGVVAAVVPTVLGYGVVELGGGRRRLGAVVDPSVGFVLHVEVAQPVRAGEALASVHAADAAGVRAGLAALRRAVRVGEEGEEVRRLPLVLGRVLHAGKRPAAGDSTEAGGARPGYDSR